MNTPTFLTDLAQAGPLVIRGSEAYLVSSPADHGYESLRFARSSGHLDLIPAGDLGDLVKIHREIRKDEIYTEKKEFIEDRVQKGFLTEEERKRQIGDKKLFTFIVKELMPYLSGHKEDLSDLLGEEVKRQHITEQADDNAEVLKRLSEVKEALKREQETYAEEHFTGEQDETAFMRRLIGDVLIMDGQAYRLQQTAKESDITIGTQHYRLEAYKTLPELEKELSRRLAWTHRLSAIDEFTDYIAATEKAKLAATKDLDKIMQLKEFNDGDIGFLRAADSVFIYQIIPPFAMLDPRPGKKGIAYEFPRLRVGMKIRMDGDRVYLDEPVLIEPEWHPFIQGRDYGFQHLCGGNIPRQKVSDVEWVAKALDDAKNLVMHGLTPESIIGHGGNKEFGGRYWGIDLDDKLSRRRTTEEEARKKGLIITNRWTWEDG